MDDLLFQLKIEAETEAGSNINPSLLSGRVVSDSRMVKTGDIFVAVNGPTVDGHLFVEQAVNSGAAIIVYQDDIDISQYPSCHFMKVFSSASSLGRLAQVSFGKPASELKVFGVTGTNGKTTVTTMLKWILDSNHCHCGLIGTIGYDSGNGPVPLDNTTPGSVQLAEIMSQMVANGMAAVAMECSSHGLHQRRTEGIYHTAAAFTNLTGDHMDYHTTIDHYRESKAIIFDHIRPDGTAVINRDDPNFEYFYEAAAGSGRRIISFAIDRTDAELTAIINSMNLKGSDISIKWQNESYQLFLPVPARHNISNFLAAAAMAIAGGLTMPEILSAMDTFPGIPGRLSSVNKGQDFSVLIDYAHTDDALEHALSTVTELTENKVILVFGCGGDRDSSKRPRMAAVASKYADLVIVTNDNPRTENPQSIITDILSGMNLSAEKVKVIPDRRDAINFAISAAGSDDCVLIAGKGHEDYQLIGHEKYHFDDSEEAAKAISSLPN